MTQWRSGNDGATAGGVAVRARAGFTLFELLLVLAIILVLGALIYPSMEGMYGSYRMTAAVDMVRASWAGARSRAIEEGRPYRFSIVPGAGKLRVAPDSDSYWSGGGSNPDDGSNQPPLIQEDSLPKGISFARADTGDAGSTADSSGGGWSTVCTFLPDGTASDDVSIEFAARGGGQNQVLKLRGLTGVVRLQRTNSGGQAP
jgi:prepilin-type N-terminal cleavage/methylation domain-containing protein